VEVKCFNRLAYSGICGRSDNFSSYYMGLPARRIRGPRCVSPECPLYADQMIESLLASLTAISPLELLLIAAMAVFASMVGGIAGYGTGALMPLVLVPVLGPEPVVPIIAISALFNNTWRAIAFKNLIDWRRALLVALLATPTTILSAYGYTLLTGRGAGIVIGTMLMLTVPLRYLFKRYVMALDSKGLAVGAVIYGGAVGGTVGAGVILLSLLMAAGLQGAAVVATDAVISMVVTAVRMAVFGFSGVIDARVVAFALLIGTVALPAAFMAKALVARMSVNFHTAILDVAVLIGGAVMIYGALAR
jgi:uncharacterized membrane protein YfcA